MREATLWKWKIIDLSYIHTRVSKSHGVEDIDIHIDIQRRCVYNFLLTKIVQVSGASLKYSSCYDLQITNQQNVFIC